MESSSYKHAVTARAPYPPNEELEDLMQSFYLHDTCTWLTYISYSNIKRFMAVDAHAPLRFKSHLDQSQAELPDTLSSIADPGAGFAHDEGQAFTRLANAFALWQQGKAPCGENELAMCRALHAEMTYLETHHSSQALRNYQRAVDELLSTVYQSGAFRADDATYRKLLKALVEKIISTRKSLSDALAMPHESSNTQSTIQSALDRHMGKISEEIVSVRRHLNGTRDTLRKKIDSAKEEIITTITASSKDDDVKKAMVARASELIKKRSTLSLRSICEIVVREFEMISGAYRSPDALRKRLSR